MAGTDGVVATLPLAIQFFTRPFGKSCDKDVALMVPRFAGASLGLLAFAITIVAGLLVQNPATVILSRSIFALFVFFVVGFVVGAAAQMVLSDRHRQREAELQERYKNDPIDSGPQGLNSTADAESRLSGEEVTA